MRLRPFAPPALLFALLGCQSEPYGARLLNAATPTSEPANSQAAATAADRYTTTAERASVTEDKPVVMSGKVLEYRLIGQSRLVVYVFNPATEAVEIDATDSSLTRADGAKMPVDITGTIGPGRFIRLLLPPPIFEKSGAGDPIARAQSDRSEYGMIRGNLDASQESTTNVRDAWDWPKGSKLLLTVTYKHNGQTLTDQLELTR